MDRFEWGGVAIFTIIPWCSTELLYMRTCISLYLNMVISIYFMQTFKFANKLKLSSSLLDHDFDMSLRKQNSLEKEEKEVLTIQGIGWSRAAL